jgi:hypothetical protein
MVLVVQCSDPEEKTGIMRDYFGTDRLMCFSVAQWIFPLTEAGEL